jgi:FkbM family methyltransferase
VPAISYAQRYEDVYLARCFGDRSAGFYIDIGAGHPVYDNVSFVFYLRGWHGITVEPNPWLARLSRAVRPRDTQIEALVGAQSGTRPFYLIEDYHGLSTAIESHARSAHREFGKKSTTIAVPALTLRELCQQHAPETFDFLKVDVEGVETEVLLHADWQSYRPKVLVVEALAPYSLAPVWPEWEPCLERHGYRYVWFDTLNRYYVAEEASELADLFEPASELIEGIPQFRNLKPAVAEEAHPDHRLAALLVDAAMLHLPLLDPQLVRQFLTIDIPADTLARAAAPEDIANAIQRVFGSEAAIAPGELGLRSDPSLGEVYEAIVDSDRFRAACGRISASYGW